MQVPQCWKCLTPCCDSSVWVWTMSWPARMMAAPTSAPRSSKLTKRGSCRRLSSEPLVSQWVVSLCVWRSVCVWRGQALHDKFLDWISSSVVLFLLSHSHMKLCLCVHLFEFFTHYLLFFFSLFFSFALFLLFSSHLMLILLFQGHLPTPYPHTRGQRSCSLLWARSLSLEYI